MPNTLPPNYLIHALTRHSRLEVLDSEQRLWAFLKYESWLSTRARGDANGQELEIAPLNIFNTRFDIYLDGEDVGDLVFNWKAQMVIRLLDFQRQERQYLLRRKGGFKSGYVLEDDIRNPILSMTPFFNWKGFRLDFRVHTHETQYLQSPIEAVLAICAYAANLHRKAKSAGGGG